jgi:hypothetical protein
VNKSRERSIRSKTRLYPVSLLPSSLLKNSLSHLILGGAALQRCDKLLVSDVGFSR